MLASDFMESVFHPFLLALQEEKNNPALKDLIPTKINVKESYRCYRSFRRSAESHALDSGLVKQEVINLVHRWSKFEASKGKQPGFSMMEYYAEGVRLRKRQLTFSRAL